jgi:1-acyl-sn-glycerol-3-phosphate acyltransferase
LIRAILLLLGNRILSVEGWHWLDQVPDPFLLAINHSQRLEALLVPTLLFWRREGRLIHFLADWNFLFNPLIAFGYWRGGIIPVTRKPARPRFLNRFQPWLVENPHGYERARIYLDKGRSIGIFPEGTTNQNPTRMLSGHSGAARLSLETGCPVIPLGIRFPKARERGWVSPWDPLHLSFGPALYPPVFSNPSTPSTPVSAAQVQRWHEQIMQAVATQAEKSWSPHPVRRK